MRRSSSWRRPPRTRPRARTSCVRHRRPIARRSTTGSAADWAATCNGSPRSSPRGCATRLYYVTYAGNSFDTHVQQADLHSRLLMYTADAVRGFMDDMKRIGRADDVAVMMFTEFGRRVEENGSLGTDHGTATPMFVFGKGVKGGLYGQHPSLTDLDDGNLKMTTDFRRVYATMIKEWLGYDDTQAVLKQRFDTLGVFA